MRKFRIVDLYCCAGGSAMGYHQAGFEVVGVDWNSQPRFPFEFIQAKAEDLSDDFFTQFDAIHASPPCQRYSLAQRIQNREHPDLIASARVQFKRIGKPYILENVVGAPLENPIMLCGSMFPGLSVYRHRLFETNFPCPVPQHPEHIAPLRKMGRRPQPGDFMHIVGNFTDVAAGRLAMGIDWMTRNELSEAIPPAYAEYVGRRLLEVLNASR